MEVVKAEVDLLRTTLQEGLSHLEKSMRVLLDDKLKASEKVAEARHDTLKEKLKDDYAVLDRKIDAHKSDNNQLRTWSISLGGIILAAIVAFIVATIKVKSS